MSRSRKRLPALSGLLVNLDKGSGRRQSVKEQKAIARKMVRALGGKLKGK